MAEIEPWYSLDEISKQLGVSKVMTYRWLEKGTIPAYRKTMEV